MPYHPYSVDFLVAYGGAGTYNYTVPVGRRAIIKASSLYGSPDGSSTWLLKCQSITCVGGSIPGGQPFIYRDLFVVAYPTWTITLVAGGSWLSGFIAGYLLTDDTAPAADWPSGAPLPADQGVLDGEPTFG